MKGTATGWGRVPRDHSLLSCSDPVALAVAAVPHTAHALHNSLTRKPLLPTAEQLERMQEYSLTIKQESDVRAAAARLPGDFVDAGDILDLLRMGM